MITASKKQIRTHLLKHRLSLTPEAIAHKSKKICDQVVKLAKHLKCQTIAIYHPIKHEPNLLALLKNQDFRIALPRVTNKQLIFHAITAQTKLIRSHLKIKEPSLLEPTIAIDHHTLLCVPALAATQHGYRIGYGGGYYDRFLSTHPQALSIVTIFSDYIFTQLPMSNWDIAVKFLCHENNFTETNTNDIYSPPPCTYYLRGQKFKHLYWALLNKTKFIIVLP